MHLRSLCYITKSTFPTLGTKEDIYQTRRYGFPIRPVVEKKYIEKNKLNKHKTISEQDCYIGVKSYPLSCF